MKTNWQAMVAFLALMMIPAFGLAQKDAPKKPLTEEALLKLVKSDLEEEVIVTLIKKRGVAFSVDDDVLERLKDGGASSAVLTAVRKSGKQKAEAAETEKEEDTKGKPLATANHAKGLVVEVIEVKTDDNKPLLTIRWRYRNPTKRAIELIAQSPRFVGTTARPIDRFWGSIYYLEGNKADNEAYRCSIVKDTGGKLWCSDLGRQAVIVKPGEDFEVWAKFARAENGTEKISFHILDTPLMEDIALAKKKGK